MARGERRRFGLRLLVFLPIAIAKATVREGLQRSSPRLMEIPPHVTPFPSVVPPKWRGRAVPVKPRNRLAPTRVSDPLLHCTCRKPDNCKLMIQCDTCEEWFHGRCVGLTQDEADRLDHYFCPSCPTVSLSLCRSGSDSEEGAPEELAR
jgi:hypothetical protein